MLAGSMQGEKPARAANAVSDEGSLFLVATTCEPSNSPAIERAVPTAPAHLKIRRIALPAFREPPPMQAFPR